MSYSAPADPVGVIRGNGEREREMKWTEIGREGIGWKGMTWKGRQGWQWEERGGKEEGEMARGETVGKGEGGLDLDICPASLPPRSKLCQVANK